MKKKVVLNKEIRTTLNMHRASSHLQNKMLHTYIITPWLQGARGIDSYDTNERITNFKQKSHSFDSLETFSPSNFQNDRQIMHAESMMMMMMQQQDIQRHYYY